VVLAARRAHLLAQVAEECRAAGGDALAVPTDVTRESDVDALRDATLAQWGRIDVWVNNAGTTLFALLDEGEFSLHRRVIETNLLGAIYAARVVLPVFRRQRAGTLINVSSLLGAIGQTYVPSYAISKFGMRGLTEALRADIADEPNIHACTVLPYAVETPHFQSGGNMVGRAAHPMPPVQYSEDIARAIASVAQRPQRVRHVPRYVVFGVALHRVLPRTTERVLRRALTRFHFGAPQATTEGNLFVPTADAGPIRGDRRPLVSSVGLALWTARELLSIVATSIARRLRGAAKE
jgi:NAD(P)-dependent dehydrogenase (short-subunit alcohol dehydrogenase family)